MEGPTRDPTLEELQRRKLALENQDLERPFWQRPVYLAALVPVVLALAGLSAGWSTGFFEEERERRKLQVEELRMRTKDLEGVLASLKARQTVLLEANERISNEYDTTRASLASLEERYARTVRTLNMMPGVFASLRKEASDPDGDVKGQLEFVELLMKSYVSDHQDAIEKDTSSDE